MMALIYTFLQIPVVKSVNPYCEKNIGLSVYVFLYVCAILVICVKNHFFLTFLLSNICRIAPFPVTLKVMSAITNHF